MQPVKAIKQKHAEAYMPSDWMDNHNSFFNQIIIGKQKMQDQRIDALYEQMTDINIRLNTIEKNVYNYSGYFQNNLPARSSMKDREQNGTLNKIIEEMYKIKGLDDIRDQIACCVSIHKKTLTMLKEYKCTDENNYYKKVLHLFFQAIKRNYAKDLFTDEQSAVLLDMLKGMENSFIDEDEYWKFDERLYTAGLSVFPEEE